MDKKTGGIFDNDEAQLMAKQCASSGLKKVKTVDLLKQEDPGFTPKCGMPVGFSYNPAKTDELVKAAFNVQLAFDGSLIVHIEIVYSYDKDTDILITLGANFDGLSFRTYQLQDILPYTVFMRVIDESPFDEHNMQEAMQNYFNEKQKSVGREYGWLSLMSGGLNQMMDFVTFGKWTKLSILPKQDLDCSGTVATLINILWAGKSIRRKGQSDYIIHSCVTPGDILNAEGIEIIYKYC